ncbi:REP-associated tyrosine transposase [Endothiovibrio diazotrophicus]
MGNYRRSIQAGATYFFTVVAYHRIAWFDCEERVGILREAFRRVRRDRPFEVEAIVVLPDHVHALWRLPEGDDDYSGRWREIKKFTSRHLDPRTNRRNERPVWQRRFWEHQIRDERDWRAHVDYIHFNPVKHGYARHPAEWNWSSFAKAVERGWYAPDWGAVEPSSIQTMQLE